MNSVLSRAIINISILVVVIAWAIYWASNSISILYNSYFTPCEITFYMTTLQNHANVNFLLRHFV